MHPGLSRRVIHPLLFASRREPVAHAVRTVERHQWLSPDEVAADQQRRLSALVAHFRRISPVYAELLTRRGTPAGGDVRPEELPILGKPELTRLYREAPRPRPAWGRTVLRVSGGSTGAPAMVLTDAAASAMSLGARAVCQSWYGIGIGDRQVRLWGRPLAAGRLGARLKDLVLNRVRIDSLALEGDAKPATLGRLRRFGVEYLYGYASMIALMAEGLGRDDVARHLPGLKAVISTSETMGEQQTRRLAALFGCPVVDEYGCSETDIVSFRCPAGGRHVLSSNIVLEVKRFGDEPEGYGQVLVTDLNNRHMPVIRYLLGDLMPLETPACECGRGWPCHGPVLGRAQGQYIVAPGRGRVHSQYVVYMIEDLVVQGLPVERFQIVQEAEGLLRVFVVSAPGENLDTEDLARRLADGSGEVLGEGMDWRVETTTTPALEAGRRNKYQHFRSELET